MSGGNWTKRDNLSTDRHQELMDLALAGATLTPSNDGTEVRSGPFGHSLSSPRRILQPPWVTVKVTSKTAVKTAANGSTSNVNLAGGWYGGRLQVVKGAARDPSVNLSLSTYMQDAVAGKDDVYVMFVPEDGWGLHTLPIDGTKYLLGQWDGFAGGVAVDQRPVVRVDGIAEPIFQLVANATPNGVYTAYPLYPSSTQLATANSTWLTQSNMGTVDSATTVYLANEAEYGLSGHKLLFDGATYLPQVFRASYWKQADDGKPVFRFFGMQWKAC